MPITELVAVARGMEYASQPGLAQLVSPLYSVQRKVRILLSKGGGWMLSRLNTTSESASKAIILIPDSFHQTINLRIGPHQYCSLLNP